MTSKSLSVTTVATSKERLAAVRDLSTWADELQFAYAWVTSAGGQAEHFNSLELSKVKRGIVGLHFAQTEPNALEAFRTRAPRVRAVLDTVGVFHPKILVGIRGGTARVFLGSSNFTVGGFRQNVETNVLLEGSAKHPSIEALLRQIEDWWSGATPITLGLIRGYRAVHSERPRPASFAKRFPAWAVAASHPLAPMSDWTFFEYLEYVRSAEDLGDAPFDLKQTRSLASELGRGLRAFETHRRFADMPVGDRRLVAGLIPESSGWLGRMVGAGRFKHIVGAKPHALGKHLDRVPLQGDVQDAVAPARAYLRAATKLDGVGLASASRVLVSKRPDCFFAVNSANRHRANQLFKNFGGFPTSVEDYMAIHAALWELPLFRAPRPRGGPARVAWAMRIALLDRLLYAVTADVLGYDHSDA